MRFLKKSCRRKREKFTVINCADVTKIRKTRVVRGRMSKIRARASPSHAHNAHNWKHVISSKSTKAIVKAVYQYYYGDISAVEKGEIADSILYQTLDVFFEILNHCS